MACSMLGFPFTRTSSYLMAHYAYHIPKYTLTCCNIQEGTLIYNTIQLAKTVSLLAEAPLNSWGHYNRSKLCRHQRSQGTLF